MIITLKDGSKKEYAEAKSVIDIADDTVIVEFGNNKNCRIPMQKAAISAVEKPEEAMEK